MKQQINLYQKEFYIKHVRLPAKQLFTILLVVSSLLFLVSGGLFVTEQLNKKKLMAMTNELNSLKNNNSAMQSRIDNMVVDSNLRIVVTDASKQLQARQRIMEWVEQSSNEGKVNFSELLEGFGRQHVSGLWLSSIEINTGGHSLNLKGSALNPKLMPELLAKLNNEPAFVGREFNKIIMQEDEESVGVMRFFLTANNKEEKNNTIRKAGNN